MKTIILYVLLLFVKVAYAQESTKAEIKDSKIESLIYTVDSIDELKTINWEDVKDAFKQSKDSIVLGFRVKKEKQKENKLEFMHSFKIKTETKKLDECISIAKKVIKLLDKN